MPNKPKEQFVVKLTVTQYRDFAEWITGPVSPGSATRRYQIPETGPVPDRLSSLISDQLHNTADLFENCAQDSSRKWDKNIDGIRVHRDDRDAKRYPVAVPETICENEKDEIDLDYLKSYVAGLCQLYNDGREEDAALALLGMYFLSRCR